jgi:hypothetical protein
MFMLHLIAAIRVRPLKFIISIFFFFFHFFFPNLRGNRTDTKNTIFLIWSRKALDILVSRGFQSIFSLSPLYHSFIYSFFAPHIRILVLDFMQSAENVFCVWKKKRNVLYMYIYLHLDRYIHIICTIKRR